MIQRIIEKADVKHSVNADKILKKIKNYDIVSFDIFDTLLKRNVKEPTDVFSYMEKKYQIDGFCEKRIEAEKTARKKKNGLEVTLKDIYTEPKKKDIEMFADFRFFDEGETQYLMSTAFARC